MTSIDDLLASERARPGYTDEAKTAMWSGIERSIAMGAAAGMAAGAAGAAGAKATTAAAKIAVWKLGAVGVGVLAVGAGLGALGHARLAEPRVVTIEKVVTTTTTVTVAATAPPTTTALSPAVSVGSLPSARAPAPVAPPAATPAAKDPDLARERTLLDMARTALGRGDAAAALSAVNTHAREFERSQLAEEREVLAVQALASAGRRDEATRRAAAFHTNFPKSALGAVVDDAVK